MRDEGNEHLILSIGSTASSARENRVSLNTGDEGVCRGCLAGFFSGNRL